jgi:hypothetical protein
MYGEVGIEFAHPYSRHYMEVSCQSGCITPVDIRRRSVVALEVRFYTLLSSALATVEVYLHVFLTSKVGASEWSRRMRKSKLA